MNAWSLLYEELEMSENESAFWNDDTPIYAGGYVYPSGADDVISFGDDGPVGGSGEDYISFDGPVSIPDFPTTKPRWKYDEEKILSELSDYISGTYNQHYSAGTDKVQTLDLIEACGDGESFCRSNILKYASRYDKKGTARRDIMKILHYAVLLLHFNDKNAQRETYPQ
jgi:hypothetical protein